MSSEKSDAAGYLGWFLFGATLGAVAAFLTAPRTGQATRELLAERSGEVTKRAQEWAGDAQIHAGEWLDKSRELFEEQTRRLISAFEAGKEAMREEIRKWSTSARG
ncbi:MAG: YtxH domain-containing protein [Candidatus Rokubacteria bacterium]|nr:YtxH domain-containing protein [Candidatus Rokubacteria bacterium]